MVAGSQEAKCGLKYVIHSLGIEFELQLKTIKKAGPLLTLLLISQHFGIHAYSLVIIVRTVVELRC
jgi:hypothetical protein